MRLVEIVEAVPLLFLLITFVAIVRPATFHDHVIIGVTGWTGIAASCAPSSCACAAWTTSRAAKAWDCPAQHPFRHMLPNALTPVIAPSPSASREISSANQILSFLGIGVVPPIAAGARCSTSGNPGVTFRWWLALPPGVMIFLTVFAYKHHRRRPPRRHRPQTNKLQ